MVFSSLTFICVFLPVVFLLSLAIPHMKAKNVVLSVASLLFYAYGEPVFVVLMIASTIVNYAFGRVLGRFESPDGRDAARRKAAVAVAVVLNLCFLGFFKYAGMFTTTVNDVFGTAIPVPDIALPIGISFYTFQAMSYMIDVYRGDVASQRSYLNVLLYISFFPQLIAGPIIKYHDIEDQLDRRTVTLAGVASGFRRFCVGLAKKVLIANTMAVAVDSVFGASPDEINVAVAWIGAIAYVAQIYFDFSGYSDMAIGMARMFGFTYKENFDHPYVSTTVKEFWRRWHISLSTWFKEYLYIPLGGNRKGRARTAANKIVVFFCCGLWHGAAWTFVAWGLIHGFFLLLEEYLPIRKLPKPIGWLYTFLVVTFAFVLFRAESFDQGLLMMQQMVTGFHFDHASVSLAMQQLTPLFVATLVVAAVAATPVKDALARRIEASPRKDAWDAAGCLFCFVLFVASFLALTSGGYNPFIYFRF